MVRTSNNGMVGTPDSVRTRRAVSMLNGVLEASSGSGAASVAGSDYSGIEFTREDVEVLLSEKTRAKSKYNYKERCDNMLDYIKRLRHCIRWYQQLEGSYEIDQENLRTMLESSAQRRDEIEEQLRNKEEELNSVIMELRKNYTTVQEKLSKEESEKLAAVDSLFKEREARQESDRLRESLSEEVARAQRDLQSASQQISVLTDAHKRAQEYNISLQQYNCKLQADLDTANDSLKQAEKEKAIVMENLSELRIRESALQEQLTSTKASYDEAMKHKDELGNEVACLRKELQQIRDDRDRQLLQVEVLMAEVSKYKSSNKKSVAELDSLALRSNELEAICSSQIGQIKTLEDRLAAAEEKLEMSDLSAIETRTESEGHKQLIRELQTRLAEAEFKLIEGEKLRKKLHNTILELKGNIRVFCRVRPLLPEDNSSTEGKIMSFPTSTEALGRGIDLVQNGQKHCFSFDQVFMPDASQEDVFIEISQLVQSALDGYKVCIFAYGQTGSGKTYTMMGRPGHQGQKGLIPRSLEQIFKTVQSLECQGWKYELQVSMLEIYNETIRDLLSTNRASVDTLKTENGAAGKQYAIKHDANGNTFVSDLTVVNVHSSKEVALLLNHAALSRSVGKTQMNEHSSRSHFVFTLKISGANKSTDQQVQGVLNLIDLAGSERLSKSGSTGDRLRETQAINKSLSSLGDVIFSLAKRDDHVPFRNSKLTYLLQPCLGGDSKTLMFVNISPEPSSLSESLCSLRFASRVNACEIGTPRRQTNMRPPESRLSYV